MKPRPNIRLNIDSLSIDGIPLNSYQATQLHRSVERELSMLLSENERTRVWMIRLAPGERIGFHRHVLDYFWTAVSGGRGRQHVHDGTTVEYTYQIGETRHETYGAGEFKVHDLENLGDREMIFMTVEFKDSANKPMPLPAGVKPQAAAA